jgi:hypothetical protein
MSVDPFQQQQVRQEQSETDWQYDKFATAFTKFVMAFSVLSFVWQLKNLGVSLYSLVIETKNLNLFVSFEKIIFQVVVIGSFIYNEQVQEEPKSTFIYNVYILNP